MELSLLNREDLITGDKFKLIAEKLDLAYVITHELPAFLSKIRLNPADISLISHRSDGCILPQGQVFRPRPMERDLDFTWYNIPINVKFWFAQNCDVRDKRLFPIPIGVENDEWTSPQRKKEIIIRLANIDVEKRGLAYLNVNRVTNFERPPLYQLFQDKAWCTAEHGKNGVNYENFAQRIWTHKFTFCPEGNGMGTHRPWEALYLGSFPIVRRRVFTEEFSKYLPFVLVDDWEGVTEEFLMDKYKEFTKKKWNYDALKISWWESLIKSKLLEEL